ncbi:1,2-dihydroxy-3-keto-5-methylthiopentene dioxygenase [Ophiocordyceps camponoti-floridani]|uniref:Acireductone dioxygenase n=1 Tax=Ophiocordyceps camponoti-floridani TaxID=2030778 RepID=A0A8H4Q6E7_9HYPO|nr:1,2-dihydroxy-3-keto-5-methylthiopentene dioxygenase [Ophiocordyceps camponoti-floridani]
MKAYIYDNIHGDQRLPHDSRQEVSVDDLSQLGVEYFYLPKLSDVNNLATNRGYKNRDEIIVSPEALGPVYEEKVKSFFEEHLHEDEEIRYIQGGVGFFDVRGKDNVWVRVMLTEHDLLILPAGIYHRFTTDTSNYVHAMRLFKDEPKWKPLNRCPELEGNAARRLYIQNVK